MQHPGSLPSDLDQGRGLQHYRLARWGRFAGRHGRIRGPKTGCHNNERFPRHNRVRWGDRAQPTPSDFKDSRVLRYEEHSESATCPLESPHQQFYQPGFRQFERNLRRDPRRRDLKKRSGDASEQNLGPVHQSEGDRWWP